MKITRLLRFLCIISSFFNEATSLASPPQITAGYYFIKSINSEHEPKDLPGNLLTHVIYAFIDISSDGKCNMINDDKSYTDKNQKVIAQFPVLKKKYPHLKTLFSIGGSRHSLHFSDVSLNKESRDKFVRSCVELMKKYSFDGIDLDWEVPGTKTKRNPNSRSEDPENFVKLIAEFRKQLPNGALLSAAVASEAEEINYLEIPGMAKYLDWFGVMNYTLCGFWSKKTCHHSDFEKTGKNAIQLFLKSGAKKNQIVLGVPFFGLGWKVESLQNNGIEQPIKELVFDEIDYNEIKEKYLDKAGYQLRWDHQIKQPLLVNVTEKTVISFDDAQSLSNKAKEIQKNGYGGLMAWELTGDDKNHTLLKSMKVH